ncbi:MAG: hypothetical protein HY217_01815 [Candidatus Rokubacteria bacterium]|nr:hypothetical protein [Candidatus Rokubacteria bacterium]
MTEAVLVVFTACWIAHAVPVPTAGHCEALKPDLLRTLAVVEPYVIFTAACYPVETDLRALEHERAGDARLHLAAGHRPARRRPLMRDLGDGEVDLG